MAIQYPQTAEQLAKNKNKKIGEKTRHKKCYRVSEGLLINFIFHFKKIFFSFFN